MQKQPINIKCIYFYGGLKMHYIYKMFQLTTHKTLLLIIINLNFTTQTNFYISFMHLIVKFIHVISGDGGGGMLYLYICVFVSFPVI